jgi:hypothetical protein
MSQGETKWDQCLVQLKLRLLYSVVQHSPEHKKAPLAPFCRKNNISTYQNFSTTDSSGAKSICTEAESAVTFKATLRSDNRSLSS